MLLNFPFGKSLTLKKKIFPVLFNFLFGRLFPWIMIYGTRGAQLVPRIAGKTWRISFPSFDKEIMFKITKTFRREHQKSFLPKWKKGVSIWSDMHVVLHFEIRDQPDQEEHQEKFFFHPGCEYDLYSDGVCNFAFSIYRLFFERVSFRLRA